LFCPPISPEDGWNFVVPPPGGVTKHDWCFFCPSNGAFFVGVEGNPWSRGPGACGAPPSWCFFFPLPLRLQENEAAVGCDNLCSGGVSAGGVFGGFPRAPPSPPPVCGGKRWARRVKVLLSLFPFFSLSFSPVFFPPFPRRRCLVKPPPPIRGPFFFSSGPCPRLVFFLQVGSVP